MMEMALREIGVVGPPVKPPPIKRTFGVWYPDGDIPH